MIKLAIDSWIQFTSLPLRLSSFVGVSVAFLGILYALFLVIRSLVGVSTPAGWATVIVLVLVLGGTQLTMVGVMGEYLLVLRRGVSREASLCRPGRPGRRSDSGSWAAGTAGCERRPPRRSPSPLRPSSRPRRRAAPSASITVR